MAIAVPSAPQLTLFRGDGQFSRLFLAFRKPTTIYTARVSTAPSSNDMVGEVGFDTGSGVLADVRTGMTMYVGSTLGARDLGIARIRKSPISGTFYIGEESEINWNSDAHLTVVDDHGLWAKHIKIINSVPYMDYEIAYSDQHSNFDPTPLLGPDVILWLTGATVYFDWPSIADSYVIDGSAVSSYLWEAPGASATSGLTTATPRFTYNAAGQYKVYCTVTAANGKTFTANRTVYVFSPAAASEKSFRLVSNPRGSKNNGGWGFEVELFANADQSLVEDRTQVILFADDTYDNVKQSIGPVVGRENIIAEGWIFDENINWNRDNNTVRFSISGAQEFFKRMPVYPVGLELSGTASAWTQMPSLSVRRMMWHLLHWRTTATEIMDVRLTSDARLMQSLNIQASNLWNQFSINATSTIYAYPLVDRFGMFYCFVDQQLLPVADRASIPTIMTLTKKDFGGDVGIRRRIISDGARVELSGVAIALGVEPQAYFSLAPGHVPKRYGDIIPADHLLLSSQAQANELAGLILANHNRALEFDGFDLKQNNRMIDIAPYSFVGAEIEAADTLRGIAFSGKTVPREVEFVWDESNNSFSTRVVPEQESFPDISQNGDIPGGDTPYNIPSIPSLPPINLPSIPNIGLLPSGETLKNVAIHVYNKGIYYTKDFGGHWYSCNAGLNAARIAGIRYFDITSSGALFLITDKQSAGAFGVRSTGWGTNLDVETEIWYCSSVGSTWVKVWDNLNMSPATGAPFPRGPKIVAMEVSHTSANSVTLVCRGVYSIFTTTLADMYVGGSGGFTRASPADGIAGSGNLFDASSGIGGNMIRMSNGKWVAQDLSSIYLIDSLTGPITNVVTGATTVRWAASSKVNNRTVVWGTDPVRISLDAGASYEYATNPDTIAMTLPRRPQAWGCDAAGLNILVADSGGILLKRSIDGGVNWTNSPSISGTVTALWCVGKPNEWIAAYAHMIRYSDDFFDTYEEKNGDLWTVVATSLPDILSIRTF